MRKYTVRKTANGTLRSRIADYIAEHPGCTSKAVHAAHRAESDNAHPISDALLFLVKERVIEEVYEPNGTRHLYLRGRTPPPYQQRRRFNAHFAGSLTTSAMEGNMIERSFAARRTFPDEHIERWGAVYLANPQLRARGVLFETFLLAPVEILSACARPAVAVSSCGLLPRQIDVRRRADEETALQEMAESAIAALAAESHCANGAWTEKLRHRAWPKHRGPRKCITLEM